MLTEDDEWFGALYNIWNEFKWTSGWSLMPSLFNLISNSVGKAGCCALWWCLLRCS
jgi:hypothetical protein